MISLAHGRAQRHRLKLGGTKDGKVLALYADVLQDAGAYPTVGAFLPDPDLDVVMSGVYAIPKIEFARARRRHEHDAGDDLPRGRAGPRRRSRSSA